MAMVAVALVRGRGGCIAAPSSFVSGCTQTHTNVSGIWVPGWPHNRTTSQWVCVRSSPIRARRRYTRVQWDHQHTGFSKTKWDSSARARTHLRTRVGARIRARARTNIHTRIRTALAQFVTIKTNMFTHMDTQNCIMAVSGQKIDFVGERVRIEESVYFYFVLFIYSFLKVWHFSP